MNYGELVETIDLLEICYGKVSDVSLKCDIKAKIVEFRKILDDMDTYISQMEEEAKYGEKLN